MNDIKPLILVTNDDGIYSKGIRSLIEIAREYGEVVVVAPDTAQSGQGHAITIERPLRLKSVDVFDDISAYACSGTPVDCVKLATNVLLKDRHIDLCVSGINHGSNASINIIYSGTMSAAMEASLEGITSIGFSLLDYNDDADFSTSKRIADIMIKKALEGKFDEAKLLNVNIPKLDFEEINGIKVCRQCRGNWVEEFQEGTDPKGRAYYWLTGKFLSDDKAEDTDIWALENGYVSVVPAMSDLTNYPTIESIRFLEVDSM